jgi:tRNA G37 N-methylase Trm5
MEVIAGKEDFIVTQPHLGCSFTFDFSKVYWNTRLETEHRRLVDMFRPGEAVCDVFAGVGPFAVPAGKKRVFVVANDLNPDSYTSMEGNIKGNKVTTYRYFAYDRLKSLCGLLMKMGEVLFEHRPDGLKNGTILEGRYKYQRRNGSAMRAQSEKSLRHLMSFLFL